MIRQVLDRAFVLEQARLVQAELLKPPSDRRSDMDEVDAAAVASLLTDLEAGIQKTIAEQPPAPTFSTTSDRGGDGRRGDETSPEPTEAAFISHDRTLSLLQSAIEEYFAQLTEDKRSKLIEPISSPSDGRRGGRDLDDPLGADEQIIPSDRRLAGAFSETDPRWIASLLAKQYAKLTGGPIPFNPRPADPVTLNNRSRILLVGDWGSGLPRAQKVASEMRKILDDGKARGIEQHVIHLGDVYYSGWQREYKKNFLTHWPVRPEEADTIGSWCLNANHDMYSGGYDYFGYLLADPRFKRQQRSSFFSLQNKHFRFCGLDTAYDDHGLEAPQPTWLAKLHNSDKRETILLSHHQLFSAYEHGGPKIEAAIKPLLKEGSKPIHAWFWGHEHRCVFYKEHQNIKHARLIGHGGVPVYMLHGKGADYPYPAFYEYREYIKKLLGLEHFALFGFAVLDLNGPTLTARYIDENGTVHATESLSIPDAEELDYIRLDATDYLQAGIPELRDFLVHPDFDPDTWKKPITLFRPDTGGHYILLPERDRPTVRSLLRGSLQNQTDAQIQMALNIHESTSLPLAGSTNTPSSPAQVLDPTGKIMGIWAPKAFLADFDTVPIIEGNFTLDAGLGIGTRSITDFDRRFFEKMIEPTDFTRAIASVESPASATFSRTPHMDLSHDPPPAVGQQFQVSIYVDNLDPTPGQITSPVSFPLTPGIDTYPVKVTLDTSDHFKIVGQHRKTLDIKPAEARSVSVTFDLVTEAGTKGVEKTISAMFTYNGRPSGSVIRNFPADLPASAPPPSPVAPKNPDPNPFDTFIPAPVPSPDITISARAEPADLIITVTNTQGNTQQFKIIVSTRIGKDHQVVVESGWDLTTTADAFVREYFAAFTATTDSDGNELRLAALRGAGVQLFKATPQPFQDYFWKLVDDKNLPRSISIVSAEPSIPWELMIPTRDDPPEERQPLGVEFVIARSTSRNLKTPEQHLTLNSSLIFCPIYPGPQPKPIPHAQKEANFVNGIYPGFQIKPGKFVELKNGLLNHSATVFHIACHGAAPLNASQRIYLEDGNGLATFHLSGLEPNIRAAFRKFKPLVFLNACEVGQSQRALNGTGGFAQSFLDMGASCVVAPLWSVRDKIAEQVAQRFYGRLLVDPNIPFADILRDIRKSAYTAAAEDSFAAYTFYGDPLAHSAP